MKWNRKRKIKKYFLNYIERVAYHVDTSRDPRACSDTAYRTEWRQRECDKDTYKKYSHIKKDYETYTTVEIETVDVGPEETILESELLVRMNQINDKAYKRLLWGIKACEYLENRVNEEKKAFELTAQDIYSDKYIRAKEDEFDEKLYKYRALKTNIEKVTSKYEDLIGAKNLKKEAEEKAFLEKKSKTVATCSNCGKDVSGVYNALYCGHCGNEIPWKNLIK